MLSRRSDSHYNMNHKKRGIALIFNHEFFDLDVERRYGTNEDAKSMKEMLEGLDFEVRMHNNNNITLLTQHVQDAANFDHSDYDCFVMVVLTHGEENDLLYVRDNIYRLEILWSPFTACKCPSLAGKPKLFFIQACRGIQFMSPATVGQTRTDTPFNNSSYKIPAHADFLFAFASVPGYVALRNTDTGSWFIQALCKEFRNNAFKYDILTLLTFVIQRVAVDYEHHYRSEESKNSIQKQIPCVTTSLTRLLKFNKKWSWFSWLQKLKFAETDNMKKGGLIASLFFGLISIICIIHIKLEELFCVLKESIIFFYSIIYNSIFYMVMLYRSPKLVFLIYCIVMLTICIYITLTKNYYNKE